MIPVSLLEKFGSQSFVTSTEISQMTRYSYKPYRLRNVNTHDKKGHEEGRHPKTGN